MGLPEVWTSQTVHISDRIEWTKKNSSTWEELSLGRRGERMNCRWVAFCRSRMKRQMNSFVVLQIFRWKRNCEPWEMVTVNEWAAFPSCLSNYFLLYLIHRMYKSRCLTVVFDIVDQPTIITQVSHQFHPISSPFHPFSDFNPFSSNRRTDLASGSLWPSLYTWNCLRWNVRTALSSTGQISIAAKQFISLLLSFITERNRVTAYADLLFAPN